MEKRIIGKKGMGLLVVGTLLVSMTGCGAAETAADDGVQTIVVATGNSYAPYCYLNENNELVGYEIDVLKALDEIMEDYTFDIQGGSFNTAVVSIDSGAADMVAYELTQNEERNEKYIFPTETYLISPLVLAVRTDSGISGFADMKGKKMYCNPALYEYGLLTEYNEAHPETEFVIEAVTDMETADAYRAVSNGTVDAQLTYQTAFNTIVPQIGVDNLMMTETVLVEEQYYMVSKDNQEFCDALSEAIKQLKDNGTLGEINKTWFGEDYFAEYGDLIDYDL